MRFRRISHSGGLALATMAAAVAVAAVGIAAAMAVAAEKVAGPVPALVVEVVDGDTLRVRARVWLGHDIETSVRLDGIDAPELRGRCDEEKRLAVAARDFLTAAVIEGTVMLRDIKYGKYAGRVVARVEAHGTDLSRALLDAGHVRPYGGGTRATWCGSPADP